MMVGDVIINLITHVNSWWNRILAVCTMGNNEVNTWDKACNIGPIFQHFTGAKENMLLITLFKRWFSLLENKITKIWSRLLISNIISTLGIIILLKLKFRWWRFRCHRERSREWWRYELNEVLQVATNSWKISKQMSSWKISNTWDYQQDDNKAKDQAEAPHLSKGAWCLAQ